MTEPCYTCRRRRIQCDRSGIPCGKCKKFGLDCFKERPLRWVRGVAIRGGMRGRSYEEPSLPVVKLATGATGKLHIPDNGGSEEQPAQLLYCDSIIGPRPTAGFPVCVHHQDCGLLSVPTGINDPVLSSLGPVSQYYLDYCKIRRFHSCLVRNRLANSCRQSTYLQAVHSLRQPEESFSNPDCHRAQ